MAMSGKNLLVQVGTAITGPWSSVGEMTEASMEISGENNDISIFGDEYIRRLQGQKDVGYSLGGFYEPTDTAGQVAIRNALINDTPIFFQFLPDGTTGFAQEVKVASYEVSGAAGGIIEVSIELEGSGEITLVVA